jgi:hypothetical protein
MAYIKEKGKEAEHLGTDRVAGVPRTTPSERAGAGISKISNRPPTDRFREQD